MQGVPDITKVTNTLTGQTASKTVDEPKSASLGELNETENGLQSLEIDSSDPVSLIESQSALTQQMYMLQIEQCKQEIENIKLEIQRVESERSSLLSQMGSEDVETSEIISQFNKLGNSKLKLFNQIQSLMSEISSIQLEMQQSLLSSQASIAKINALSSQADSLNSSYNSGVGNITSINTSSDVGNVAVQLGLSFVGVINSDAQGNAEFSPGGASQHWCADFVTSITKRAYEAKGLQVPSGFGSSAVSGLQSWGKSKGVYLDTASNSNRASAIASSVKPGDIMIQKRNGASHTGIVTKVYSDGSFDTVEGNSSDAVKKRHYSANSNVLSGFVLMSRL